MSVIWSPDVQTIRKNKKQLIEEFFSERKGELVSSQWLHGTFGSSVRTRISDINLDPNASITIKNDTRLVGESEVSVYFAVSRTSEQLPLLEGK